MADQEIKTGIDALVAYLNEHGETNISEVAGALGVGESAVLEWANVLEKANVISVAHKSGKLFLSPGGGNAAHASELKQTEQITVEELVSSDLAAIDQVSSNLEEFTKSLSSIDTLFDTKYKNVKVLLDKLNSIDAALAKAENEVTAKTNHVKEVADKSKSHYESAQKYLANLAGFNIDTNNARAVAAELKDILKAYERNIAELTKSMDAVIYQYRKNALDLSRGIKEKHSQLVEVMSYDEKQIREYEKLGQDTKREYANLTRKTQEIGKRMLGDIAKDMEEVDRISRASSAQVAAIRPKVDEMRKDFGQISALNTNLVGIRNDIDAIIKQRDALVSELKKMQGEARSGNPSKEMLDRANEIADNVTSLKGNVESVRKGFKDIGHDKG
ncbi:MAG: hypothetical protein ACYCO0_01590 [Candidatus Micrarchaeaceae archaeon]